MAPRCLKKKSSVVCFLPSTGKTNFTATQNVYCMYLFSLLSSATVSFKIKDSWKNSENVSSKCSCSLNDRVRATVPLLFGTTIDALLGGGRQQLHAAGPSDNNARPFGQTVDILFRVSQYSEVFIHR